MKKRGPAPVTSIDPSIGAVQKALMVRKEAIAKIEAELQTLTTRHTELVQALHTQNGARLQLEELMGVPPAPAPAAVTPEAIE